ncbi:MAG: hypothetical protein PQJ61_00435 [Spirochaetales bacterium]|uniref:Uncharacterized protein n=1 Tax=Candidatus Thalassospirochaeta sargassi TaxID=3119039 RepID=A0AAJ1ID21_9SPIO|nr:hypothetical protein [Spirochaetales bacterium]
MIIELLTPEEEILAWFEKALKEELSEMIQSINKERGEQWTLPLRDISRQQTNQKLPQAVLKIPKVKKQTVDINFIREEYIIELKITFIDNKYKSLGYRYNYLINKLFKESTNIAKIADKVIIDELIYNQNKRGDDREPSSADFKITLTRDSL